MLYLCGTLFPFPCVILSSYLLLLLFLSSSLLFFYFYLLIIIILIIHPILLLLVVFGSFCYFFCFSSLLNLAEGLSIGCHYTYFILFSSSSLNSAIYDLRDKARANTSVPAAEKTALMSLFEAAENFMTSDDVDHSEAAPELYTNRLVQLKVLTFSLYFMLVFARVCLCLLLCALKVCFASLFSLFYACVCLCMPLCAFV